MKKKQRKGRTYRFQKKLREIGCSILFLVFFNHCEAQNRTFSQIQPQVVMVNGTDNFKLSGIYSSNNFSVSSNNLSTDTATLPSDFPNKGNHYSEVIDKRTPTSRTFEDNKGGIIIKYSYNNLNYLDKKNKFQLINSKLKIFDFNPSLSPKDRGEKVHWAALEQQYPTYLNNDGSTALTSDEKNKIIFNLGCKINDSEINFSDFTVGEDGMFINNVIAGVDKKIIFNENAIETDYILRHPINLANQDLIISEEIELPEGYYLSSSSSFNPLSKEDGQVPISHLEKGLKGEDFVVYSSKGIEQARFKTPMFYDAAKSVAFGNYSLIQEDVTSNCSPKKKGGVKYILQIIIPEKWLNDPDRIYPITIDPLVTGPTSSYPASFINSCLLPNYAYDSILVTIPPKITIVNFFVSACYWADAPMGALMNRGFMSLSTPCNTNIYSCQGTTADSSGLCYLVGSNMLPPADLSPSLACCFTPSCSSQTFYLRYGLARNSYGPGCNQDYIYYSPFSAATYNSVFSAYIVGRTVETAQAEWSVFPTTVCSDSCTVFLEVNTSYGVPPYTITHPWATGSSQYGSSPDGCTSTGSDTIALTIPGCPTTCGTTPTLSIPPPLIIDVCGDSVTGLSSKSITIKPVPVATAGPVSTCSGSPFNIPVSSCVTGSTFQWMGSNGTSGTGNINDNVLNTGTSAITINYSVIPTASGCIGQPINVSAEIDTLPVIDGGLNDTIEPGISTQLNAIGGLTYSWTPTAGLSCTDCPDPLATPVLTTVYYVTGTNESGCSSGDTVEISVTQGGEVLYIPNSFTPNDNKLNDLFYAYGTSIRIFDLQIYDRWGELIFRTNDIKQGWDGKYKGKMVEGGVYVYSVNCEWLSGVAANRNGIVTVLR
ncbi:MAG: gliding motility-associated C-terminal domain-containing protein [Bacteroidetes bacterium]|nr:gliding motility-associated C-terminal domain-containing protein [Bacteroidota bacterium]